MVFTGSTDSWSLRQGSAWPRSYKGQSPHILTMLLSPKSSVKPVRRVVAAAAALLVLSTARSFEYADRRQQQHQRQHRLPAAWTTTPIIGGLTPRNRVARETRCCGRDAQQRVRALQEKGHQLGRIGLESDTMVMATEPAARGYVVDSKVGHCGLETLPRLQNRYFALRHGQSVANM